MARLWIWFLRNPPNLVNRYVGMIWKMQISKKSSSGSLGLNFNTNDCLLFIIKVMLNSGNLSF